MAENDPNIVDLRLVDYEVQALRRALTRALAEHSPIFSQRLTYNRILDVIGRGAPQPKSEVHHTPGGAMLIVHHSVNGEESQWPRRHQMQKWTPAERAIQEAVDLVEVMGADVRLTEAVILLGRARDSVADFVDGKCCVRDTNGDGNCPDHSAPGVLRKTPESVHQTYTESVTTKQNSEEAS
jgi:hypothetical protein